MNALARALVRAAGVRFSACATARWSGMVLLNLSAVACGSAPELKTKAPVVAPTAASVEVVPPANLSAGTAAAAAKAASGSGNRGGKASVDADSSTPDFKRALLEVDSRPLTNHGNVLHMMLRQFDQKAMGVVESYEQAASFVVAQVRDASVLTVQPVIPGKRLTLAVTSDSKKKLVAYFFFTTPGQNWRVELPRPLPARVVIALGDDQVDGLHGAR